MQTSGKLRPRGWMRALLMLGSALPLSVVVAEAARAQDYTNISASGRVTTEDGKPIAGAEVKVTSSDRGVARTTSTDSAGAYTIPQLAPGNYDVSITATGYTPYAEKGIALTRETGGANSFRLITAGAAASEKDIVVTGTRQRVASTLR